MQRSPDDRSGQPVAPARRGRERDGGEHWGSARSSVSLRDEATPGRHSEEPSGPTQRAGQRVRMAYPKTTIHQLLASQETLRDEVALELTVRLALRKNDLRLLRVGDIDLTRDVVVLRHRKGGMQELKPIEYSSLRHKLSPPKRRRPSRRHARGRAAVGRQIVRSDRSPYAWPCGPPTPTHDNRRIVVANPSRIVK